MKTRSGHLLSIFSITILICGITQGCNNRNPREIYLSDTIPEIDNSREVKILTAFFGLDNGLTQRARVIYKKAAGKDGMPLVFSHELAPTTLDGSDFMVTTSSGKKHIVEAASFLPANEEHELRTVLLIGEYGNYPEDPPMSVEVVGDLMTRSGTNIKGMTANIIPLPDGPILSYAEYFYLDDNYPYIESGNGCDCPKDKTTLVVKAVWSGGVRAVSGDELGDKEKEKFIVTMVNDLDTIQVTPFQLADLGDNENNIDLCIKEKGIPIYLKVDGNIAIDLNDDPNPPTEIEILSRW